MSPADYEERHAGDGVSGLQGVVGGQRSLMRVGVMEVQEQGVFEIRPNAVEVTK